MRKKDIKSMLKDAFEEMQSKPDFLIHTECHKESRTMCKVEGTKADLLFGLLMTIKELVNQGIATEKDIRKIVDLCFLETEELEEELVGKLKEIERRLDNIIKKL